MKSRQIVVIAHNIRSIHNVGSLFRTCDGIGVNTLLLSGYTPYPESDKDVRLPHIAQRATAQINKTALDSIYSVKWNRYETIDEVLAIVRSKGFQVCGLEQSSDSIQINKWRPSNKVALILGNELDGIESSTQAMCDTLIEIPMYGKKESFNVVQASAMALYRLRFLP